MWGWTVVCFLSFFIYLRCCKRGLGGRSLGSTWEERSLKPLFLMFFQWLGSEWSWGSIFSNCKESHLIERGKISWCEWTCTIISSLWVIYMSIWNWGLLCYFQGGLFRIHGSLWKLTFLDRKWFGEKFWL